MILNDSYDWGNVDSPWIGADVNVWQKLIDIGTSIYLNPGDNLYFQDDAYSSIYVVTSGRIRISMASQDGNEIHLYIACPGALVGEASCYLSRNHITTATAIIKTTVYAIPSKEAQMLFHKDPFTADMMIQYEARKSQMLISQIRVHSFDSAEQRLAKTLLHLCNTYGVKEKEGQRKIDIKFTYSDLASIVATSRVTVNNLLLEWKENGLVEKKNGYYYVNDLLALQNIAMQNFDLQERGVL